MLFLSLDNIAKLLTAFILGGVIGFEREIHDKPAGFRTHILVSLASALFTILSLSDVFGDPTAITRDPARVAAAILTGMGFLGAGVIISTGGHLKGITTAATLWITAAIGMAAGLGEYGLAIASTLLVFFVLTFLYYFECFLEHFKKT